MAAKTTLNARNLETLGAARLAELLMEISTGSAAAKRRLRLELAAISSPADFANEIRKRLLAIGKATSPLHGPALKTLVAEIDTQRQAVVERVANPVEALALMWQLLTLAAPVLSRCDYAADTIVAAFGHAAADLPGVVMRAKPDPLRLGDMLFQMLKDDFTHLHVPLIEILAEPLGRAGIAYLKQRLIGLSQELDATPADAPRVSNSWVRGGPAYEGQLLARQRRSMVRRALELIADVEGDVDGLIALVNDAEKRVPQNAALIAQRLLAAGRTAEAWAAIEAADVSDGRYDTSQWEEARLEVMEALGRSADAQRDRWKYFQKSLDPIHLKAFLKRLPDFDDMEAEDKAMAYVAGHANVTLALEFLVLWPSLDKAAAFVRARAKEIDGDRYEVLTPAAEALAGKHPLAATILLRAMIDFTLARARSGRYRYAARHLDECQALARGIADWGDVETHREFTERLARDHARKQAFWGAV